MPKHRTLRLILPSDWYEVPGQTPREFRSRVEGTGVLQVSLRPPQQELAENPDHVLPWLQRFIRNTFPELGESIVEEALDCVAGPGAFSVRPSDRGSLVTILVVASEAFIFATFISGTHNDATAGVEDAVTVIESAYFEDGTGLLPT